MRDPEFKELELEFFDDQPEPPGTKLDLWQRLSRVMEAVLYLLILAGVMRIFWPEVEHQKELNAQLAQIEQVRSEQEAHVNQLHSEYEWLKNDRGYLESVARDRLDLYRPGADEYVVRIKRPEETLEEESDPGSSPGE